MPKINATISYTTRRIQVRSKLAWVDLISYETGSYKNWLSIDIAKWGWTADIRGRERLACMASVAPTMGRSWRTFKCVGPRFASEWELRKVMLILRRDSGSVEQGLDRGGYFTLGEIFVRGVRSTINLVKLEETSLLDVSIVHSKT